MGVNRRIWTKISTTPAGSCITDSLSHTTYVKINNLCYNGGHSLMITKKLVMITQKLVVGNKIKTISNEKKTKTSGISGPTIFSTSKVLKNGKKDKQMIAYECDRYGCRFWKTHTANEDTSASSEMFLQPCGVNHVDHHGCGSGARDTILFL